MVMHDSLTSFFKHVKKRLYRGAFIQIEITVISLPKALFLARKATPKHFKDSFAVIC